MPHGVSFPFGPETLEQLHVPAVALLGGRAQKSRGGTGAVYGTYTIAETATNDSYPLSDGGLRTFEVREDSKVVAADVEEEEAQNE